MDIITNIIIIVVALAASAFFSGMEIAFLASNKLKLELDRKQNGLFGYVAGIFGKSPNEYMTATLVGNNIVLVIYSLKMSEVLSNVLSNKIVSPLDVLVETVISTMVVLFIAEFLPKSTVKNNPNIYYKKLAFPMYIFYLILYPISKLTSFLSIIIMKLLGMKGSVSNYHKGEFNKKDLVNLVSNVTDKEQDKEPEIKIFQNALDFPDLRVRDCMLRRIDIEALDIDTSILECREVFTKTKYSRLPVFSDNIDHILGYINIKDMLKDPKNIKDMMLDVMFVPETMLAQRLLTQFIKSKNSVAIVIDEFGGTAGLVTIEDILEEIFGEIEDEHDTNNLVDRILKDGSYLLSARLEIEYLNDKYNLSIEENSEYDTLAGYIIFNLEGLPLQGEEVVVNNLKIKVLRTSSSRIELVKVTRI